GKSSLRPLMAGSSPSLPDGSNPSAAIVQSASDVQCSRLLKTTSPLHDAVLRRHFTNHKHPLYAALLQIVGGDKLIIPFC
ncbi:hypothetical protein U9481_23590, partial [Escherichia coli]